MREFLFQAYGSVGFHKMAYLAVTSLIHAGVPPSQITVFTDAAVFGPLGCRLIPADRPRIKEWQGVLSFHHRLKIELIRFAYLESRNEEITYLDADTFVHQVPLSVSNSSTVLFDRRDTNFPLNVLECYKEASGVSAEMWIAGVIGLRGECIEQVCAEALRVSDAIQIRHPQKIEYAEQYGFSAACNDFKKISSDREVSHYWNRSREIEAILNGLTFEEIARINSDRFHQMCADADKLQKTPMHRLGLRIRRFKRSWTKRKREFLAAKIRKQTHR